MASLHHSSRALPSTLASSDLMKQPPATRRRRADAQRSIASIIDAATQCFGSHPDASMSEIANAAGVGRVTLYAHFPSREAVLGAAIDHAVADLMVTLDTARIEEGTAPEALGRLVRAGWLALDWFWGLHVAAHGQSPSWVHEHGAPFLERVARLIERGRAEGLFRDDLPTDWLVEAFFALIHTAGQEVNQGRLAPHAAADVLEATLLGILAAPAERAARGADAHRPPSTTPPGQP